MRRKLAHFLDRKIEGGTGMSIRRGVFRAFCNRQVAVISLFAAAFLCFSASAFAQGSATLTGTVTDP